MGGTWSLGTATWSLGTTTWSLVGIWLRVGNDHMVVSGYHHLYGCVNDHNGRRLVHGWCKQPLWCFNQNPELLSFVDSQWCLYSRLFHAGGLGMRNFLCGFHSYLRQTSFSSTGNLQSQFLNDNIHSIIHHENLYLIRFQPPVRALLIFSSIKSFHHSTFMLSFRSEDWGIFSENFQMCASESWFFWGNPYQFFSFAGFVTHGPLGRQDFDHDGKVHFEAALIAFMSIF